MGAAIKISGQRFGRLVAVSDAGRDKHGKRVWKFRCDCGNDHIAVGSSVTRGKTQSCGCAKPEVARANGRAGSAKVAASKTRHGRSVGKTTYYIPEYGIWKSMRQRCLNPRSKDFPAYGGRGIRVCERWSDFANFISDMGERPTVNHSIDRVDPNGNYEPSNCRWADDFQQAANRRKRGTGEYAQTAKENV